MKYWSETKLLCEIWGCIIWLVLPCGLADRFQHFRETYSPSQYVSAKWWILGQPASLLLIFTSPLQWLEYCNYMSPKLQKESLNYMEYPSIPIRFLMQDVPCSKFYENSYKLSDFWKLKFIFSSTYVLWFQHFNHSVKYA